MNVRATVQTGRARTFRNTNDITKCARKVCTEAFIFIWFLPGENFVTSYL